MNEKRWEGSIMEDFIQVSAKTKEEAITNACIKLGISSDKLEIVVVSEGSHGFFGIGSKPAIIKARKKWQITGSDFMEAGEKEQETKEKLETEEKPILKENRLKQEKKENIYSEGKKELQKKETVKKETIKTDFPSEKSKKERQLKALEILSDPTEIAEIEERARIFLQEVFDAMGVEAEIRVAYNEKDGCLEADFEGEDMGILIGKRGQTLDSLQYLTNLVVNKKRTNYIRVKLDTEDYRKRRRETLENLARGIAYKVKKTRRPVILEPMNPYERRVIHSALQGNRFVETTSEGEEPYRHVVVKLKRQ